MGLEILPLCKDRSEEEKGGEKEKNRVHLPGDSVSFCTVTYSTYYYTSYFCLKNQERKPELTHLTHCITKHSFYRALIAVKLLTISLNPVFDSTLDLAYWWFCRLKLFLSLQCTRELLHLCINFCRVKFRLRDSSGQTRCK